MQTYREKIKHLIAFIGHQLMSTLGVIILSGFSTFTLFAAIHFLDSWFTSKRASWILTEIPGFPVQIATGIFIGFLVGKYLYNKAELYVWILPLLILCFGMVFIPAKEVPWFSYFFGRECSPVNRCFDQFFFTLPCFSSAGYSFGATMARKITGKFPVQSQTTERV